MTVAIAGRCLEVGAPVSKVKPQFECKWCHRMFFAADLKEEHGRYAPLCMAYRTDDWLTEHEYSYPGRDEAVLRMAGLIKMVPHHSWYSVLVEDFKEVQKRNRVERVPFRRWEHQATSEYISAAPEWAIKMARQLVEDQSMIQRLKIGRKQKRSGTRSSRIRQREGLAPGYILMIPIEVRAQILQAAASNPLVHAMVTDEQGGLETAIIIARDFKKKVGS